MKVAKAGFLLFAILGLLVAVSAAQDAGADVFKTKCAVCHGADGGGKIGPNLKTIKLGEGDIVALLSKGEDARKMPHKKPISGLTEDQVKAVAHYVKSLK
ncbi:MAG TPA: cytochrome c [Terriglobales bacterium]